jgi:hypothetical protein
MEGVAVCREPALGDAYSALDQSLQEIECWKRLAYRLLRSLFSRLDRVIPWIPKRWGNRCRIEAAQIVVIDNNTSNEIDDGS